MYNQKLDGFWYDLRGNKKTGEIFNFSLKSNRNAARFSLLQFITYS